MARPGVYCHTTQSAFTMETLERDSKRGLISEIAKCTLYTEHRHSHRLESIEENFVFLERLSRRSSKLVRVIIHFTEEI